MAGLTTLLVSFVVPLNSFISVVLLQTESKDVQAEETPAESDKKSVHLHENQSGKEEELAKKDQASDENHEDRKEEDQTSSQEVKTLRDMPGKLF